MDFILREAWKEVLGVGSTGLIILFLTVYFFYKWASRRMNAMGVELTKLKENAQKCKSETNASMGLLKLDLDHIKESMERIEKDGKERHENIERKLDLIIRNGNGSRRSTRND